MSKFSYHARLFTDHKDAGIIDGDTQILQIDLGFYHWFTETIRLSGVDTHETHFVSTESREYKRGVKETIFVEEWYTKAESFGFSNDYDSKWPLKFISEEYDSYGKYPRVVGRVKRKSDGEILNERLLQEFDDVRYE